jgi:butyryl-CoA dehydrogenase
MDTIHGKLPDWPAPTAAPEEGPRLADLVARLAAADGPADEAGVWPAELWAILTAAGGARWSLPETQGGDGCDRPALVRRYARAAEGSLTAAFLLTQHDAAVRRLAGVPGHEPAASWLRRIAAGDAFATVGISQLTTSQRLGPQALVASEEPPDGFRLDGMMPWVTAAARADVIVTGAVLRDGRQLLIALPTDRPGLAVRPPLALAALQASCTSEVACVGVPVTAADVLAGPGPDVLATPGRSGTGGLETSALALGQARAALVALAAETVKRGDLSEPIEALADSWRQTAAELWAAAEGRADAPPPGQIRSRANGLVLRATQAYLTARKGTGFLRSETAQRWARQALFFLVWSCPTPVAQAALRDLAGLPCP